MRLIDADSLKTKVEAMVVHRVIESDYDFGGNQAFDYVADILIDDAPTIDAVPVVRCKDCKHAHMTYGGECKYCDMWEEDGEALYLDGDFFCAYGERREDGEA